MELYTSFEYMCIIPVWPLGLGRLDSEKRSRW